MKVVLFIAVAAVVVYCLHRLAIWMEDRGWIYYRHHKGGASVGNAFLEAQTLVDPGARHLLEVQREEWVDEDESGDPPPSDDGRPGSLEEREWEK